MYFLCVDESGQAKINSNTTDDSLYILSGVLVHEKDWRSVQKQLVDVKQDLFPESNPDEWELHASDIWNSRKFFSNKNLNLNFAKKYEIFSKVVDIVCKSEITLVNVIIFKNKLEQRGSHAVLKYSWQRLTVRFEDFLEQNQIGTDYGLFIIDSMENNLETRIKDTILTGARSGRSRLGNHHVIENPIFVDSFRWNLIQLADMVAYVVHKYYNKDPMFEGWFKSLDSKMYRSGGQLYGFGINEIPNSRYAKNRNEK